MGPFSHGIMLGPNIGLCLLLLSVNGIGISGGLASVQNEMPTQHPAQESPLPYPPPQLSGKRGSPAEPTSGPDTKQLKQNEVKQIRIALKQAGVALPPLQNHKCRQKGVHKHSLLFTVSWNHHNSFAHSDDNQKRLNITDKVHLEIHPEGGQTESNPGRSEFLEIFRKLKTLHLMTCKTCSLKFGHIRTRTPGQHQVHTTLLSDSTENIDLQHHRNRRSLRADGLMLKHLSKSERGYVRKKRSAKKNKHRITDKSEKHTTKGNRRPQVNQEGKLRTRVTTKKTTGGVATLQTTASPVKKTDHGSAASQTVQASEESFKQNRASAAGGKMVDEDHPSLGDESSEERQTTLTASSRSAQRVHSSDKESFVENGTYLGLDGRPVNLTELLAVLKEKELQRKLQRDAQLAYLCLVMVACLMMWALWWLGGLDGCRYRPDSLVRFTDLQPLVTVKDVLRNRRKYLPMFNEPEWEEVLMCNRGSDP